MCITTTADAVKTTRSVVETFMWVLFQTKAVYKNLYFSASVCLVNKGFGSVVKNQQQQQQQKNNQSLSKSSCMSKLNIALI